MAKKENIQEDETKNVLKARYFADYDWTRVIGKIDLVVRSLPQPGVLPTCFLWAETKQGRRKDIFESFIQLILTIGKGRIFEYEMPPYFLGAADAEKIAFVEYNKVMQIFSKTDFNWNVTPSDHSTKEFRELYDLLRDDLANDVRIYKFVYDDKLIRSFIRNNFKEGRKDVKKQSVGKNNFTFVYFDWVKSVKDSIAVDWQAMQKAGILDCDFFLADLMSKDGMSIKDKLKVVLEKTKYKVLVKADLGGIFGDAFKEFSFKDGQKAYNQFWNRYERPPKPVYQRYILDRRDLLVPQDIREIKGSYYTPEQWVRLSQEYLAKALGEDWQEEYYVWDCAAGSGNLLRGLTNKYNIYASTLDDSDVKVMHDAIDGGRLNLLKNNVFQFDFLNDGYEKALDGSMVSALATCSKIPESLRKILADPEKRKKLVIYINPPYKEPTDAKQVVGTGQNVDSLASSTKVYDSFIDKVGTSVRELFTQFLLRIYKDCSGCIIGCFSTLKHLQASNFKKFRSVFKMELRNAFLVPGYTFDNVSGKFPICFQIWKLADDLLFDRIPVNAYDSSNNLFSSIHIIDYDKHNSIIDWLRSNYDKTGERIAYLIMMGTDVYHNRYISISNKLSQNEELKHLYTVISANNLFPMVVYCTVRNVVENTWLNNRDQYIYPCDSWAGDMEFQTNCLVWSIFNNTVRSENEICHWIPFYEDELNSPAPFNSRFMADFLHGKVQRKKVEVLGDLFTQLAAEESVKTVPIEVLSPAAKAVLDAGREIWKYYMSKPGINVNASFLDIRAYFQGFKTTEKGKRMMNSVSSDQRYMDLLTDFRQKQRALETRIEPKIYEHGFLLR